MSTEAIPALIIDDDRDTADLFSMVLRMVGFRCDVVYSAKAALDYLASHDPQIILLDMRLGLEISGTDILYQIRSNPRLDSARVIVITAYPQMAAPIHDLADLVMLKPVEIEHLKTLAARLTQGQPKPNTFREPLTNLYYYNFFLNRLEFAFERTRRHPDFLFAVMVIELQIARIDHSPVQHEDRECLLRNAAEALNAGFRPTDTFGRLDHDRIVALYEDLKQPADAEVIVRRLRLRLARHFEVNQRTFLFHPLIGVAMYSPAYQQPVDLLQAAIGAVDTARQQTGDGYFIIRSSPIQPIEKIEL